LAAKILGLERGDTANVPEGDGGIRKRCHCRKARQIRHDIYNMRCITDIRWKFRKVCNCFLRKKKKHLHVHQIRIFFAIKCRFCSQSRSQMLRDYKRSQRVLWKSGGYNSYTDNVET